MPSRVQPWREGLGLRKPQGLRGARDNFRFLLFFLGVLTGSIRFAHRACAALVSALRVTIPNAKSQIKSQSQVDEFPCASVGLFRLPAELAMPAIQSRPSRPKGGRCASLDRLA